MLKRFYSLLFLVCVIAPVRGQTFPEDMGATPYAGSMGTGTTFRVWAGSATNVQVVGTFNNWNRTTNSLFREGSSEIWSANIAGARPGQQYHYLINGNTRRRDPRGTRIVDYNNNDSIIYDQQAYQWKSSEFTAPPPENMVIYELHVGTFNDPNLAQGGSASLDDARARLDYIASLGANTVKIMPVTEFPGTHSWGYNPTDLYAVDNLIYGGPDALKRFVDDAHQRGIAVILDIVHNHYGSGDTNDLARSLWNFDGHAGPLDGGIYFYQDPIKAATLWGRRPDYQHEQVRAFIKDNARSWLRDYRLDGFRWDATKYIRLATDGSTIAEGESLLREINTIIKTEYTNKISIAEDLEQRPSTTAPTNSGGLAFDSDWQTEVHFALVQELSRTNGTPDLDRILSPSALNYTSHTRRVVYTESHDEVGLKNGKFRVPYRMNTNDPSAKIARQKSLLAAGLMITSPGIPMLFQGQEMYETVSFDDTNSVNWTLTNTYAGIHTFYKDAIRLRQNYYGNTGGLTGKLVTAEKQLLTNGIDYLISMHRRNADGAGDDVFVVANLSTTTQLNEWITFPFTGSWYAVLNSDSTRYSSDFGNTGLNETQTSSERRGMVSLAPWSFVIYARAPMPGTTYTGMAITGPFRSWDPSANMSRWHDHTWSADIFLNAATNLPFKFFANGSYAIGWGAGNINTGSWPVSGTGVISSGDNNLTINIPENGTYRFTFNSASGAFTVRRITSTPITTRHPSMAVAGEFNNFTLTPNMAVSPSGVWTGTFAAVHGQDMRFKFASYGAWDISWGGYGDVQTLPASGYATQNPFDDLKLRGPLNGLYTYTFNDVTGQFSVEKSGPPPPYASMQIIGSFNQWGSFLPMTSNALHYWEYTVAINQPWDLEFRIAANNTGYDMAWGSSNVINGPFPASGSAIPGLSNNIIVQGPLYGTYTITFDSLNWQVSVVRSAPPAYPIMAINGSFNSWSSNSMLAMVSNGLHQWSYTRTFSQPEAITFKFNNSLTAWADQFGVAISHAHVLPAGGTAAIHASGDNNISLQGPLNGAYTIHFNSDTLAYSITRASTHAAMAVAGLGGNWDAVNNMYLNEAGIWTIVTNLVVAANAHVEFKFKANYDWNTSWGDGKVHTTNAPASGTGSTTAGNIRLPGPFSGNYRFTFNDYDNSYAIQRAATFTQPIALQATNAAGNKLVMSWPSYPYATYSIERSTNLALPNAGFTNHMMNVPDAAVMNVFTVGVGHAATEFYRVRGQ